MRNVNIIYQGSGDLAYPAYNNLLQESKPVLRRFVQHHRAFFSFSFFLEVGSDFSGCQKIFQPSLLNFHDSSFSQATFFLCKSFLGILPLKSIDLSKLLAVISPVSAFTFPCGHRLPLPFVCGANLISSPAQCSLFLLYVGGNLCSSATPYSTVFSHCLS